MATAVGSEDEFRCSICLDLFNNPVTTPCGHNFCKSCISSYWDLNSPHRCPLCKQQFKQRPSFKINTLVSEMVSKIRSSQKAQAGPGDVSCDVCAEPKFKAVKSCLDCAVSYCQNHLDPHLSVPMLKKHDLIRPVQDLKERMCPKHGQPLKQYCCTDQSFICATCSIQEHHKHKVVSLKEQWDQRMSSLKNIQTSCQQMVAHRRKKILKFQDDLERAQAYVDKEMSRGLKVFSAVLQLVQRRMDQFLDRVNEKQKQSEKQLQDLTQQLKKEICDLEKRISEVDQLQSSDDYFYSLNHCNTWTVPEGLKDWSAVRFLPNIYTVCVSKSLSELKEHVVTEVNKCDLEKVQQCAVDITLDPDTAHGNLSLSEDLKQVHHTDEMKKLPDSPLRYTVSPGVLGKQSFSECRFYFEVQVRGKTMWDIGVTLESVNRQDPVNLSPQSGYWTISLREGSKYYTCTGERLTPRATPQKVGVFVDCFKGIVSFYGVDTADLIYSFSGCRFDQKLLTFCSPGFNEGGTNSSPLVFSAVDQQQNPRKKQKL